MTLTVNNRDYHYLSQSEIAGAKRIYQHLSEPGDPVRIVQLSLIQDTSKSVPSMEAGS
jgi:hypothetical protein